MPIQQTIHRWLSEASKSTLCELDARDLSVAVPAYRVSAQELPEFRRALEEAANILNQLQARSAGESKEGQ